MFNKTFLVALVLCACYFGDTMARPQLPPIPGVPQLPQLPQIPGVPGLPGVGTITGVASDAAGGPLGALTGPKLGK
ncbi:elastin [Drosophila grimshawi]|uniref:GH24283 n=1 Tax=Drosophila grimshawi TaxID=7222 RepID=B4JMR0_DROGR|nr:elastin [Drosophila grimshawi]EDV92003.1 GH24283 [Drosophila grimshawi]